MLAYIAPFLVVFVLVLCAGSVYYVIESLIRSSPPKRTTSTNLNYINFKNIFSS